jgi:hypothetical protein
VKDHPSYFKFKVIRQVKDAGSCNGAHRIFADFLVVEVFFLNLYGIVGLPIMKSMKSPLKKAIEGKSKY